MKLLRKPSYINWAPKNHTYGITTALSKLIFLIGTKAKLDFGEYVFNQTMRHSETFIVKLPITFPCLTPKIILSQHHGIVNPDELQSKKGVPLTFDY